MSQQVENSYSSSQRTSDVVDWKEKSDALLRSCLKRIVDDKEPGADVSRLVKAAASMFQSNTITQWLEEQHDVTDDMLLFVPEGWNFPEECWADMLSDADAFAKEQAALKNRTDL
jgi:hypothetical protein